VGIHSDVLSLRIATTASDEIVAPVMQSTSLDSSRPSLTATILGRTASASKFS
jgi:hypothetical protein